LRGRLRRRRSLRVARFGRLTIARSTPSRCLGSAASAVGGARDEPEGIPLSECGSTSSRSLKERRLARRPCPETKNLGRAGCFLGAGQRGVPVAFVRRHGRSRRGCATIDGSRKVGVWLPRGVCRRSGESRLRRERGGGRPPSGNADLPHAGSPVAHRLPHRGELGGTAGLRLIAVRGQVGARPVEGLPAEVRSVTRYRKRLLLRLLTQLADLRWG
jgi:hypothetical protein